jgi:hypothetical protein
MAGGLDSGSDRLYQWGADPNMSLRRLWTKRLPPVAVVWRYAASAHGGHEMQP